MKKYLFITVFALIVIGCGEEKMSETETTPSQVSDGAVAVALPDLPMLKSNPINELEK